MAIKTQPQLESQADIIKNEQDSKKNTALRIGTMLVDFIQSVYNQLSGKVDKVENKGLSENDFTNEDKSKLDSLSNYDDTLVFTELANKSEQGDIDMAINNLKGMVPTDGDTLKKLYDIIKGIAGVSEEALDIADRDSKKADLEDQQNIYVEDASADNSVTAGWAIYKYIEATDSFIKITEKESIDVDFSQYVKSDEFNSYLADVEIDTQLKFHDAGFFNESEFEMSGGAFKLKSRTSGQTFYSGQITGYSGSISMTGLNPDTGKKLCAMGVSQNGIVVDDLRAERKGIELKFTDYSGLSTDSLVPKGFTDTTYLRKVLQQDTIINLNGKSFGMIGFPTSAAGLTPGSFWVDTSNDGAVKAVL